ncbi:MAG: Flp pilus assembly complex ATPase component TadA, partial [Clostridia bacterium]|nr:Flp pilus assembly complex ATPase component TadA [Clostridia bacterium]
MTEIKSLLERAVSACASDIFIVAGFPESFKIGGKLTPQGSEKITPERSRGLITALFSLAEREMDTYLASGDDDFSFSIPGLSRFRVSAYRQRNSLAAVVRVVSFGIPDYRELHIPETVMAAAEKTKGLILVTGTAGSGKSTTLACLIDRINANRSGHIITLEDPIEYLHRNKQCIVSQREIAHDTENYVAALRAALRQAPDVIFVGEMRDYETIKIAMTAAETG